MNIYITASGKKDGFGSQYLSKILAILFCKHYNFNYVHTKLSDLDFKEFDAKIIENTLAALRKKNEHTKLKNKLRRAGKGVSTFREGKSGGWKDFFDDHTYKKFISYLPGPIEKVLQK